MLLYLIRHGQSESNAAHLHCGWAQVSLTEQGRAEALNAKKVLDGIDFDRVYSSDLLRAQQTCAIALPQATPVIEPLLREINVGELMGKTADECLALYGESYLTNKKNRNFKPYGGETSDEQVARLRAFLSLLEKDPAPRIAAFCHEWSILSVLHIVCAHKEFERRPCKNGGVCIFSFAGGRWQLQDWNL